MAKTVYGVNDPEAVKLWSRKTLREALKKTWVGKFVSKRADSVVQIKDDTSKGPGDRIRCTLVMPLAGRGVQGDATQEGNEERLSTYTDDVVINQIRNAVRSGGHMSEQRVPFSVREHARVGLEEWFADRMDTWFFNQLAGNSDESDTIYTGQQAATAADSAHRIYANGHSTETDITATSGAQFTLSLIDQAVLKATTLSPVIRPVNTGVMGANYVMFVTPEMRYDLRRNSDSMEWADIQRAAMEGGKVSKNPLFDGALGVYNGVVLHEAFRLPIIDSDGGSKIGRAVLCGAQAAVMAFGREGSLNRMSWVEELFDYKNQLGVSAGLIAGLKKTRYNSQDYATIAVSAAHSSNAVNATGR